MSRQIKLTPEQIFAENCKISLEFFVRNAVKMDPSHQQLELIRAVQAAADGQGSRFISVRSGHGIGKTSMTSVISLWWGLTRPDAKIPVIAPTSSQVKKQILPEIAKWYRTLFTPFQDAIELQGDGVKFKNGNSLFVKAVDNAHPEALAGIHATSVMAIVDEASGVGENVFSTLMGAFSEENHIFIMLSNPTRLTGFFYDSHHKNKHLYKNLHFSSLESSNVTNDTYARMIESSHGIDSDIYRIRVLGEFGNSDANSLFPLDLIEQAMGLHEDADRSGVRCAGVDAAFGGGDQTMIAFREGMCITHFEAVPSSLNPEEQAEAVLFAGMSAGTHKYFVDAVGVGVGLWSHMNSKSRGKVTAAKASMRAMNEKKYFNKRAEMYGTLLEFLRAGGAIPADDELKEELLATQAFLTSNGKIQIIKKEILKKDIGRSPDKADAVSFCFYNNRVYGKAKAVGSTDAYWEESLANIGSGANYGSPGIHTNG